MKVFYFRVRDVRSTATWWHCSTALSAVIETVQDLCCRVWQSLAKCSSWALKMWPVWLRDWLSDLRIFTVWDTREAFDLIYKVKLLSRVRLFATPWTVARLLCPLDSPGKNTGVGCHFLLQRIFLTQGSNLGLPHCKQTLYPLSHQGRSPNLNAFKFNI